MKKFLLTLIVTMLTCLGAWAEPTSSLNGTTITVGIGETKELDWATITDVTWSDGTKETNGNNLDFEVSTATKVRTNLTGYSLQLTGVEVPGEDVTLTVNHYKWEWNESTYQNEKILIESAHATIHVNVKGNTCTWSYNGSEWTSESPVQIIMDKADDALPFEFTTLWEEKDDQSQIESVVSHNTAAASVNWSGGKGFYINSVAKGEADITVTAKNGNQTDTRTIHVIVNDRSLATSLSLGVPSENPFYQGTSITVPVTFAPETATFPEPTVSPANQGVTAVLSGNTLTISATESAPIGDYTITVSPQDGSDASAQSVTVTVKDKTHASSIDAPETVSVAYGYTKDIPVTFEPTETAVVTATYPTIDGVTFSSETLNKDNKTITVNATDATVEGDYTITLTSGAGTADVISKTISLSIVAPIGVDDVKFTNTEIVDNKLKLAKGSTITLNAVTYPTNAANTNVTLALTSNGDNAITFDPSTGLVTANNRGEAVVTATSVMNSEKFATVEIEVTDVIPVTLPEPSSKFRIGETHPSAFGVGGDLSIEDYDITYTSSDPSVITVDGNATSDKKVDGGVLAALKKGKSTLTVVVTPKKAAVTQHYTEYTNSIEITVSEAEYGLTIAATPAKLQNGTVNVAPTVTLNDVTITEGNYQIEYTLNNAPSGVTINSENGEVTVPEGTTTQMFSIVATLNPTGADAANYKGATATASVFVGDPDAQVTISVDADGVYTVNVPSPGAFGALSDDPITGGNAVCTEPATLDGLKSAASVKVTGYLANSDVRELVNLIGGTETSAPCKKLDMGSAQMTEAIEYVWDEANNNKHGLSLLPAFVEADASSASNTKTLQSVENLTLPQPAPGATVLPKGMKKLTQNWNVYSGTSLTTLTIPEGWTEVAPEAYADLQPDGFMNSGIETVQTLTLPNSLIKIGAGAFAGIKCRTLYIPNQVDYIGDRAFSNNLSNTEIGTSDIYFTGKIAPSYVHEFAFTPLTQICNKTANPNIVYKETTESTIKGTTTRKYISLGEALGTIMHFPEGCEDEYLDTSRSYEVVKEGHLDNDWDARYKPDGWTDEFINKAKAAVNDCISRNSFLENTFTVSTDNMIYGGFPDATYGSELIWPSFQQFCDAYALAFAGFTWGGEDMRQNETWMNKKGLYQFVLALPNAPSDQHEWVFEKNYEQGLWYTFSVPFDMSIEQIENVFGANTQVVRISKVVRDTDEDVNVLKLEFRKSVMADATDENITYYDGVKQSGIRHHWPYMIKPGGKVTELQAEFYKEGKRRLPNYVSVPGELMREDITAVDNDNVNTEFVYTFCPILQKGKIKKNSYAFGTSSKTGKRQFVFYKGKKNPSTGEYEDGGTASANTAYVQLVHGVEDGTIFFGSTSAGNDAPAPVFMSLFADDEDATAIEKVEIVCGNDKVNDGKVYTINGVLVNGTNLPAGLYIKNGKKFIVK